MKLVEHRIKHGEILVGQDEKILSFGIDKGTIYFWGAKSDKKTTLPPNKYVVLDNGDDVTEYLQHVATLVEGITPKHIFLEYIPPKPEDAPKSLTKIITDEGIETIPTPEEK